MKKPTKTIKQITVKTSEENPIDVEIIAENIIKVSDAFEAINSSRLNRKAVITLIYELSKVPKRNIDLVLHNAALLKKYFIKP